MGSLLDLSFIGLTILFTAWNAITLAHYLQYRRLAPTAELTWRPPRPWFYNFCLGMGFFLVTLTIITTFVLHRPWLPNVSQALMALFYVVIFPLSFQIARGFYRDGIWSDRGFVPYEKVQRLGWLEKPELILYMTKETDILGRGSARLAVPGERYGQARRILASHIEDESLVVEKGILGLSDPETQPQEQI